jgi:electron transport complex protein RnfC
MLFVEYNTKNMSRLRWIMMKKKSFPRGIHPPDFKSTAEMPIVTIEPKKGTVMRYPMIQHIGKPCKPVVAVGDEVKVGQIIGDSDGVVSAPVHATVSGKVVNIGDALSPKGQICQTVFVENDGLFTESSSMEPPKDYKSMSNEELLTIIRNGGIVGLGGAGFPTHVKLNPPKDKPIDTILVNAAECEPYLTTDHRVMLEETEKILTGLEIVLHLFPEARGIIAVEDNKPDAITKFRESNKNERISIKSLAAKYPQGGEKMLIYTCTGREVPSGGLPMDIGCIVHNVDTLVAIYQAVVMGRPLLRKVVTVTGGAVEKPGNYQVPLGLTFQELLEEIGGTKTEPYKMVVGGPMMGVAQSTLDVPVIKTSAGIILMTEKEAARPPSSNCFRCGKCVSHCPLGLMPLDLSAYASRDDKTNFKKYNGMDCTSCACCSYVCPAHRHVAGDIIKMKEKLLK